MDIFNSIKINIKEDMEAFKKNEEDDILEIVEDTDGFITVYEDIDMHAREYTITNPDRINIGWVKDRIIITDSAKSLDIQISEDELAHFILQLDKNMLLTLNAIIILNDSEEDYDYLSSLDEKFAYMLETNDLPDEDLIGLMWHSYQVVFINLGVIIRTTNEMRNDGLLHYFEEEETINRGILETLVHEIRHLAQANPYLPEDVLNQTLPDEDDAEEYVNKICSEKLPYVILY